MTYGVSLIMVLQYMLMIVLIIGIAENDMDEEMHIIFSISSLFSLVF